MVCTVQVCWVSLLLHRVCLYTPKLLLQRISIAWKTLSYRTPCWWPGGQWQLLLGSKSCLLCNMWGWCLRNRNPVPYKACRASTVLRILAITSISNLDSSPPPTWMHMLAAVPLVNSVQQFCQLRPNRSSGEIRFLLTTQVQPPVYFTEDTCWPPTGCCCLDTTGKRGRMYASVIIRFIFWSVHYKYGCHIGTKALRSCQNI